MRKEIKLMAEYGTTCLWWRNNPSNYMINWEEIPISDHLKNEIMCWEESYTKALDWESPTTSVFPNEATERQFRTEFEEQGKKLWA
jgi:hypothetical protein